MAVQQKFPFCKINNLKNAIATTRFKKMPFQIKNKSF